MGINLEEILDSRKDNSSLIEIIPLELRRKQYKDFYPGDFLSDIKFKYSSEYYLATVLNYLNLTWRYRPVKFPLGYDKEGRLERFTPTFYLPREGIFLKICLKERMLKEVKQKERLNKLDPNLKIDLIIMDSPLYRAMYQTIVDMGDDLGSVTFAHESERDLANLFDLNGVVWRYEPTTFPLVWDENGRTKEAFTPDFHLPQFDLYIELTTMRQRLVTKKNRKVRLFKQKYPEENIEILYGRDYKRLKEKRIIT